MLLRAGDKGSWLHAEVEAVSVAESGGCEVLVEVTSPLPADVRTVQVREDDAASLRVLAGKLQDLAEVSRDQVRLALAVTGRGVRTGTALDRQVTAQVLARGQNRWNAEQERAVGQALGSELTFIWGPPGTGKTDVLAAVVEGCYRQGQRVLFLAPTHVAVDQAPAAGVRAAAGRACVRARPGAPAQGSPAERAQRAVRDLHRPQAGQARLDRQIEDLRQERARLSGLVAGVRELDVAGRTVSDLTAGLQGAQQSLARVAREWEQAERQVRDLDAGIAEAGSGTGVSVAWRRRLPDLTQQRAAADAARQHAAGQVAAWTQGLAQLRDEITRTDRQRQRLLGELGPTPPSLAGLQQALARVETDLKRLDDDRANLGATVRAATRVTATTVAAAVAGRPVPPGYDTVVLDEAGTVDLASAFAVTALAARRVVLAGDFRQLPALVKANPTGCGATTGRRGSPGMRRTCSPPPG